MCISIAKWFATSRMAHLIVLVPDTFGASLHNNLYELCIKWFYTALINVWIFASMDIFRSFTTQNVKYFPDYTNAGFFLSLTFALVCSGSVFCRSAKILWCKLKIGERTFMRRFQFLFLLSNLKKQPKCSRFLFANQNMGYEILEFEMVILK